jgi:hypothetical protein
MPLEGPNEREQRRIRKRTERDVARQAKKINRDFRRVEANEKRKDKLARQLKDGQKKKTGCAVTAISVGIGVATAVAAWKGVA